MHHDLERKSKRERHVLPKELKVKRLRDASKVSTSYAFDIVKKAEADESAREPKSEHECKDKVRMEFK